MRRAPMILTVAMLATPAVAAATPVELRAVAPRATVRAAAHDASRPRAAVVARPVRALATTKGRSAGHPPAIAPPSRIAAQRVNLLAHLGSSLRPPPRPSARGASRLTSRQATLLGRVGRLVPGLVPPPRPVAGRHVQQTGGVPLLSAADLYIAPNAVERLARQLDLLHGAGIHHMAVSPANVVVTQHGELQLVSWTRVRQGGSAVADRAGLQAIRRFMVSRLGLGG